MKPATPVADSSPRRGGLDAFLESAVQEQLVLSYWFDSVPRADPYPVVLRITGRRAGVTGRPQTGDQFVHDETIDVSAPGAGRASVTVRINGFNSGEWNVTEKVVGPGRVERRKRGARGGPEAPPAPELRRAAWSLHGRKLAAAPAAPVKT